MNKNDYDKFLMELQDKTVKNNTIAKIAKENNRDYITPEDVQEAINRGGDLTKIRLDVLEVMADNAGFGCEDRGLIAFVAFRGEKD